MFPIKKILWPTDFSEPSYKALQVVKEAVDHFDAEVCAVHVITTVPALRAVPKGASPGIPTSSEYTTFNVKAYQQELKKEAAHDLDQLIQNKLPETVKTCTFTVFGDPAQEIVRIARENDMDCIIIATHGKTGLRRMVFGSVAEKVMRMASCPILSIRAFEQE